jgi:hypothetical protein
MPSCAESGAAQSLKAGWKLSRTVTESAPVRQVAIVYVA